MPFDMIAFGSTAARAAVTAVPPMEAGSRSGYNVINTNFIRTKWSGAVWAAVCKTAAVANVRRWRFHDQQDAQYAELRACVEDQTGVPIPGHTAFLNYPYPKEALLSAEVDNNNVSGLDIVLMVLAQRNPGLTFNNPLGNVANVKPVSGASATAAVASTWTFAPIVWDTVFETAQEYRILGMSAWSATMYAARLAFPQAPSNDWHPGVWAGGDSITLQHPIFGDFGTFKGDNPPALEVLCSGTDAAQTVTLWVIPARK